MKKTFENSVQVERLEQETARSLSQGWTLWNSTDPFVVIARLLLAASITGCITALINLLGNPPLLILAFLLAQVGAIAWFIWQYPTRFHRISFLFALWLGFAFSLDVSMVMTWFQ